MQLYVRIRVVTYHEKKGGRGYLVRPLTECLFSEGLSVETRRWVELVLSVGMYLFVRLL